MRRRICYQYHHLGRTLPPIHVERFDQRGGDSLWAIATPRCIQSRQMLVHFTDVGGKAKVLGHIGVVLGRMVTKCDEANTQIFLGLQTPRLVDVATYLSDVLRRRGDVAALAACAVLYKDEITGQSRLERAQRR